MVKFADAVNDKDPRKKMGLYVDYSKVAREGILVGLRRYCFFGMPLMPSYGEF